MFYCLQCLLLKISRFSNYIKIAYLEILLKRYYKKRWYQIGTNSKIPTKKRYIEGRYQRYQQKNKNENQNTIFSHSF